MKRTPKKTKNWVHYLTRPFSLFGSSLWYEFYTDYVEKFTASDVSDMMCVEESPGVVRNYRIKENLDKLTDSLGKLAIENKEKCHEILKKAQNLNDTAEKYVKGEKRFQNLREAANFFFELAIHSTVAPHFIVLGLEKLGKDDAEIREISLKLRAESWYPKVLSEVLLPMAEKRLIELGIEKASEVVQLITIQELLTDDVSQMQFRLQERSSGKKFIYKVENHQVEITWHKDNSKFIEKLEGADKKVKEIKGSVAYPGKVRGTARVVKTIDGKGQKFNEGDILFTINSNPALMHLIKKAAAIVSDEGGITCHAAIVSRELKIPCVIGTKNGSKIVKDGDMVEVDAEKGAIKIFKD